VNASSHPVDEVVEASERTLDSYLSLLLLIALVLGLLMLVDFEEASSRWAETMAVGVTVLTAGVLVLALHTSGASVRAVRTGVVVGAITVAANIAAFVAGSSFAPGLLWLLLVGAAPIVVIHRILQHESVTTQTLLGAVCAYLLIALAFSFLFISIDNVGGSEFFGETVSSTAFPYFSLVTITTLGYGDLNPATDVARLASVAEAVIGQVFLVIGVARLVALYTGRSRRRSRTK